MPIIASFGTLTYIKFDQGKDWRWWALYPNDINGNFVCTSTESNLANIYIQGYYEGNSTRHYPTFIKIDQNSSSQPNLIYMQQTSSNTTNYSWVSTYDTVNDKFIAVSKIGFTTGGQLDTHTLNQVFYPNGTNYTNYTAVYTEDSNTGVTTNRIVSDVLVYANGMYLTTGRARKYFANGVQKNFNFISSYTANGVTNVDKGIGYNINQNNTATNSFISLQNSGNVLMTLNTPDANLQFYSALIELSPNLNTINWQKALGYSNGNYDIGYPFGLTNDSNNIYCSFKPITSPAQSAFLISTDNSGSNINWQKTFANTSTAFDKLEINKSNSSQLIGLGFIPTVTNNVSSNSQIMSINTSNGNIEWVNCFKPNTGNLILNNLYCEGANLYLTGEVVIGSNNKPIFIKVPSNGSIPGSGNYNFGNIEIIYTQENIPSYSNSNLVLANANFVSYTQNTSYLSSNIGGNLANYFTYNPYRLVS